MIGIATRSRARKRYFLRAVNIQALQCLRILMNVQHSTLVAMGVRWLSRQCSVVLYEFATPADENPDVIGWAPGAGSVLIECKLSRSDFLKDATKTVRKNPRAGMGHRRYYLCPPELIQVKDLPRSGDCSGPPRAR